MVDFQIAQKFAENYPELLHLVLTCHDGNDKILIMNHMLQVKNYHSFKIQLKNANDTAYVECIKCFKMLLELICRACKQIKPVKNIRIFIFQSQNSLRHSVGQFENPLLLSDFKPPLGMETSSKASCHTKYRYLGIIEITFNHTAL